MKNKVQINGKINKIIIVGYFYIYEEKIQYISKLLDKIKNDEEVSKEFVNTLRDSILGKYIIEIIRADNIVYIFDIACSYRRYFSNLDSETNLSSTFEGFHNKDEVTKDLFQINRLLSKGYTQGNRTIYSEIKKIHPSAVYYSKTKKQVIVLPDESDRPISPSDIKEFYCRYFSIFSQKNIGVAFSGGIDSLFIVIFLMDCGVKPTLFHLNLIPNDKDAIEDLNKVRNLAKILKLNLIEIKIDKNDIISKSYHYLKEHINDFSFSFVAIREFLLQIEKYQLDVLFTGQNADSFLNFGLTRRFHPIDAGLLYLYKKSLYKIYNGRKINLMESVLIRFIYGYRNIEYRLFPKDMTQLKNALSNETHYVPKFDSISSRDHLNAMPSSQNQSYLNWMMCNKMLNHVGGNHSIVWSDDLNLNFRVMMPFNEPFFIRLGYQEMGRLRNIFEPKTVILNTLRLISTRANYFKYLDISRSQIKLKVENNQYKYDFKIKKLLKNFLKV